MRRADEEVRLSESDIETSALAAFLGHDAPENPAVSPAASPGPWCAMRQAVRAHPACLASAGLGICRWDSPATSPRVSPAQAPWQQAEVEAAVEEAATEAAAVPETEEAAAVAEKTAAAEAAWQEMVAAHPGASHGWGGRGGQGTLVSRRIYISRMHT